MVTFQNASQVTLLDSPEQGECVCHLFHGEGTHVRIYPLPVTHGTHLWDLKVRQNQPECVGPSAEAKLRALLKKYEASQEATPEH